MGLHFPPTPVMLVSMAPTSRVLLLLVLLPAFPAFWLGKTSEEGGPVRSTIVGLFDTVRTLTKGVGGIVDQVEEGFDEIRSDEEEGEISLKLDVVLEDNNSSSPTNSSSTSGLGSKLVIGIFDALQDLTSDVGRLVGTVEEVLGSKRGDVVKLADRVEENVDNLQTRLGDWVNNLTNTDSSASGGGTRWRVVHISKPSENSTSADWEEEPTLVEQSVLANSSKFIDDSFEEEQADLTNSSSAIQEKWEENIVEDFTNNESTLTVVEPIVVEQSVLADSSTFIQITEEEVEQEKDGSLFSTEVEVKEEEQFHW